jgi:hypothetical protein
MYCKSCIDRLWCGQEQNNFGVAKNKIDIGAIKNEIECVAGSRGSDVFSDQEMNV